MSLTRFILPGLMLGLVLSLTPSVATAGVVYGNLGSTGDSPSIHTASGLALTDGTYIASGFNTGLAATFGALKINSVTLSLSGSVAASSVEIWTSTGSGGSVVPNSLLGGATASSVTNIVNNLYTFSFNADPQDGVAVTAGTDYWVVLKGPATGSVNWYINSATNPAQQNSSTYTGLTNYVRGSFDSGSAGTWSAVSAANRQLAISVNAVPEPSTYVMAGIGAGLAGLYQLRRRRSL